MVQTPNGLKAIETFKPGDLVYSKDQFTQAPGVRPIVATKQTLDQLLYEVVVKNAQGQTETYTTTSEHPFWVTNGPANGQWLKASLLQAGLHLTNAIGETLEVVSQTALEQTATVYNIEVHQHSTYHVGEMGVWVHNADCCTVGRTAEPKESVNSAVALRNYLSEQAGIPTTNLDVWGASLDELKQAFGTRGVTITEGKARSGTSGNAQILKVQGSDTNIVQIQYSPASTGSQHKGQYYKFTYADGSDLKIVDPYTYRIKTWPENQGKPSSYIDQNGKKLTYNPLTHKLEY